MLVSQVYKINEADFDCNYIPKAAGIYKIIALDIHGNPIPFNRFFGLDKTGILYIGKPKIYTIELQICGGLFHQSINQKNILRSGDIII